MKLNFNINIHLFLSQIVLSNENKLGLTKKKII